LIQQSLSNSNTVQSKKKLQNQSKYTFIIYGVVAAIIVLITFIGAINLCRTRSLPPRKVDQQKMSLPSDSNLDIDESVCLPSEQPIQVLQQNEVHTIGCDELGRE
jgi:flagellar biosynthesis/type III secretory pathway M-ring protein FliF/YscJ